ncbi:MAG TPA: BamA/TamA family outer membrane protein, partial [Chitinophaga sp.]
TGYTTVRYRQDILRHDVLNRSILLRHGETFSNVKYNATINKLYDLGVWQFVTVNYRENRDTTLDALLFLTPRRRQSLGATFEVSTSSDYLLGSGITLSSRHLNLHRSATSLDVSLNTGIELIRTNEAWVLQSKEFGGSVNFTFPKFITPFRISQDRLSSVKTKLNLGADYLSRVAKFDITNINAAFGYDWTPSTYRRWIVNPISLNYVGTKLNPYFEDTVVNKNPYLKRSFEPAFIGGEVASYIYTNNDALHRQHYSFFRINLEESGLWLNGVNSLVGLANNHKNDLQDYTGLTISNFVKVEADYRHYWKRPRAAFATRAYAGVGVAYGSSTVLPYIRQFTAGGPNSIRAWRLRTLGPGSYHDTSATATIFPDQTGDMKLEANAEYRFDLIRMFDGTVNLKGATFLDAGNIWMLRKDPDRPGSDFEFSQLYHDLALGTGVGLRLDFSFFLIRLDWGIPLKVPYFTGNANGWYLSEWKHFSDPSWRRDNVIWNVAIGYPF